MPHGKLEGGNFYSHFEHFLTLINKISAEGIENFSSQQALVFVQLNESLVFVRSSRKIVTSWLQVGYCDPDDGFRFFGFI